MRRAFSVCVFARFAQQVLLIRHKRLNTWLPVGGEIHPGETPLEAARRELYEETGLEGRFTPLGGVHGTPAGFLAYEEHLAGSKGLHLNFVFVADVFSQEVRPNHEFHEHAWVKETSQHECPPNVHELARMAIEGSGQHLLALARRWLAAFNARALDDLLALYAEGAVHTSPKLRARDPASGGKVVGKDSLRVWWQDSMDRFPGLRYEERRLTAGGDRVFMEYERINPGEPSYMVAEVLVVAEQHIVASHVYHG